MKRTNHRQICRVVQNQTRSAPRRSPSEATRAAPSSTAAGASSLASPPPGRCRTSSPVVRRRARTVVAGFLPHPSLSPVGLLRAVPASTWERRPAAHLASGRADPDSICLDPSSKRACRTSTEVATHSPASHPQAARGLLVDPPPGHPPPTLPSLPSPEWVPAGAGPRGKWRQGVSRPGRRGVSCGRHDAFSGILEAAPALRPPDLPLPWMDLWLQ